MYQRMNVLLKVLLMKWYFVCVHYEQNMTCIYRNTWHLTSNNRKLLYNIFFNDQEMQSQMKAFNDKSTVPDISEMLASWFPSTDTKKPKHKAKKK